MFGTTGSRLAGLALVLAVVAPSSATARSASADHDALGATNAPEPSRAQGEPDSADSGTEEQQADEGASDPEAPREENADDQEGTDEEAADSAGDPGEGKAAPQEETDESGSEDEPQDGDAEEQQAEESGSEDEPQDGDAEEQQAEESGSDAAGADDDGDSEGAKPREDEPGTSASASRKEAARYYREGRELFDKELYDAAIEAFKKAQELHPAPNNLYNIAKAHERLGNSTACVEWYRKYVEAHQRRHDGKAPPDISDVRNSIQKCQLGAKVRVRIDSEPSGAAIHMHDEEELLGQTPYETRLDPGTYTFRLEQPGYQSFDQKVKVRAGEPLQLHFELDEMEHSGKIALDANVRDASVYIDGKNVGLTPYDEAIEVSEGMHQVTVKKDDYVSYRKELRVEANETHEVEAELWLRNPPDTWMGPVGWTSMVLGVGLGVGGYFAGLQADDHFHGTPDFQRWDRGRRAGYGAGGGLIGVGVLLVILEAIDFKQVKPGDRLGARSDGVRWMPVAAGAPGGGWAGASVRF